MRLPGTPAAAMFAGVFLMQLPASTLDANVGGRWVRFWRSDAAPAEWTRPDPAVVRAIRWQAMAAGVEHGELRIRGRGEAWRLRVVLVRLDPRLVTLRQVHTTRQAGTLGAWVIDSAPPSALVAFNGGHFAGGDPWGWVVREGREVQLPGSGALAGAIVVDSSGSLRIVPSDSIAALGSRGGLVEALQSYPTLLRDGGRVPVQLRARSAEIDVAHRDARLAIGTLRDGRVLVALTRFDALDGRMGRVPFGPTVPEMAAVMGALGCDNALLLDGGISAQLLVRTAEMQAGGADRETITREWRGTRRVPVGIVVEPRAVAGGP